MSRAQVVPLKGERALCARIAASAGQSSWTTGVTHAAGLARAAVINAATMSAGMNGASPWRLTTIAGR